MIALLFISSNFIRIKPFIIILCFIIAMFNHSWSQDFPKFIFTRIQNSKSLKNQHCNYFVKDRKGFTWITSVSGLYRYDGQKFALFKHDPDDPNTLPTNFCNYVLEDTSGYIWVSHSQGVSRLDVNSGKFRNFMSGDGTNNTLKNASQSKLLLDKYGKVFNCSNTFDEVRYFDPVLDKFVVAPIDTTNDGQNRPGIGNAIIGSLQYMTYDSSMYMLGWNGLFHLDTKTFKRTRITDQPIIDPLELLKDHNGTFWLGEWGGGLSIVGPNSKRNIFKDRRIYQMKEYRDKSGKYWIVMGELQYGRLIILDPITEKYVEQFIELENEITPVITPAVIAVDNEGRLTLNSSAVGVIVDNPIRGCFTNTYTYTKGKPADLFYDHLVRSGTTTSNGFMIGLLNKGICILNKNFQISKRIDSYRYKNKTYDLEVKNFLQIGPDKYILSGWSGIAIMDHGVITPLRYIPKKLYNLDEDSRYRDFVHKSGNEYWVRTIEGKIKVFDIALNKFTKPYTHTDHTKKIPLDGIKNLIADRQGEMWANSATSIYKYDKSTDSFIALPIKNSKFSKDMYYFQFDYDQNLFITGAIGLLKYNLKTKKETFYSEVDGIHSGLTQKVVVDKDNNVWFTSSSALYMLDQKNNTIKNYATDEGLPLNLLEYNGIFMLDNDNHLIMGNTGVVTRVDIEQLALLKTNKPKVAITQVKGSDSTAVISLDQNSIKHVNLTFKNFPVDIHFSIIDYSSNGERRYYYRYKGTSDTTWIECNEGIIPINTIEPGDFTVEVRGKVNTIYSDVDVLTFTIVGEWNQTKSFKYSVAFGIISLLSLLIRWRFNTAKEKQIQKTEIQRLAAEQYKNQYELSLISQYFSNSLKEINKPDEVLWDVVRNLISKLNYKDCMIYLWNEDQTKLIQKAGYGLKGTIDVINKPVFDVVLGQGVVGFVAETKQSVLIPDTRLDARYRVDDMVRLSEICVPILQDNQLIGVIDCEHPDVNHFTQNDLQILQAIANNISTKLIEIENKKELATTIENLKGAQLDALRSQMNPHFIFNSLNSIENFILKNEKIIASEYLGKFSKLIRNILDNSKSEQIPLTKEIETLKLYIELERLRTGNSFDVHYNIPMEIIDDNITIPPMLMQPHVENAILHGIRYLEDKKGLITITMLINDDDCLEYTLQDNGIGRLKSKEQKTYSNYEHKSYGIDITQNRIDLHNQKHKTNITFSTLDLYDSNNKSLGTKVNILIPLI